MDDNPPLMHALRNARHLARLALAWFLLAIGVAVAAPMVQPKSMELVCTGAGVMKLIVKSADGGETVSSHTLDCPQCLALGTPPPAQPRVSEPPPALAHALRPTVAATLAALTRAPLPARGPPAFS